MRRKLLSLCLMATMFVMGTSAWALEKNADGAYQIGTAEDFKAFADLVNAGEVLAWGQLTADIDLGTASDMIGSASYPFRGTLDGQGHTITINMFASVNGQALIRNLDPSGMVKNLIVKGSITTTAKYAAGIAAWARGTIMNCVADITINSGIAGDATHGAIAGVAYAGSWIEDCVAKIYINGATSTNSGGVAGWCDGGRTTFKNCLVINDDNMNDLGSSATIARNSGQHMAMNLTTYKNHYYPETEPETWGNGSLSIGASYNNFATKSWKDDKNATIVSMEDVKNGAVCYMLNNDQSNIQWTQTIGVDPYPVPFKTSAQVYASMVTPCSGIIPSVEDEAAPEAGITYANTPFAGVEPTKHNNDEQGVCLDCGHVDGRYFFDKRDPLDGMVPVASANDLDRMEVINKCMAGLWHDWKLTADVEYTAKNGRTIFNNNNRYAGSIDGKGHKLTYHFTNAPIDAALIPRPRRCTVKNIWISGDIEGGSTHYAGVYGDDQDDRANYVENVYCDVNITTSHLGDNTAGGIMGCINTENAYITNTVYAGTISADPTLGATNVGGLVGWAGGRVYFNNCAMVGQILGIGDDTHAVARSASTTDQKNVYIANVPELGNNTSVEAATAYGAIMVDPSTVESGELAYLLNGKEEGGSLFFQTLPGDPVPFPFHNNGEHGLVYSEADEYLCDGSPLSGVTYTNTPTIPNIPEHQFEEGFCVNCGGLDYDFVTPAEDGVYEIEDGAQLLWWAHLAAKELNVSCRLTADIDMDGYSENYPLIGSETAPFYGSFDGQFHTISNLIINYPTTTAVGLIACINSEGTRPADNAAARETEGTFIRNVTLDNSCSITGNGYVGLVGMTAPWGGHVVFYNLGVECDVASINAANAGGVLGCVMTSACRITLDNCYMTGNVTGPNENGSFSGWLGSYATVSNCYAIGSVTGTESDDRYFARYGTATITNCYAKYGTQVTTVTDEQVANGELAYLMNGKKVTDPLYYQNLQDGDEAADPHPIPNPSHGVVFALPADVEDSEALKYYSVATEDELSELGSILEDRETRYLNNMFANKELMDGYQADIESMIATTTVAEMAQALTDLHATRSALEASAKIYKNYMGSAENILAKLNEREDIAGAEKDLYIQYMDSDSEPTEAWPLGGYLYITENRTHADSLVTAEQKRIEELYTTIIRDGYSVGSDITDLFVNANFAQGSTGWDVASSTGVQGPTSKTIDGVTYYGAERWAGDIDISQTVSDLKPGYYLVTLNAAYRPSNNRYGYNYAAQLQANGNGVYVMTSREGMIAKDEAVDGVNANIAGGTNDLTIWSDNYSTYATEDEGLAANPDLQLLGYAPHGQLSMAIAAAAGRLENHMVAEVGEDGKLTVRLYNPTTKYSDDWFGFANMKVVYCGDAASQATIDAYDMVLSEQETRTNNILGQYEQDLASELTFANNPNYPMALRETLQAANDAKAAAADLAAKAAAVKAYSEAFNAIYEAKQAYVSMYNNHQVLTNVLNMDYDRLTEEQQIAFQDALDAVEGHIFNGEVSAEEAWNPTEFKNELVYKYIPEFDEDGTILLSKPDQMIYFSAYVGYINSAANAKVVAPLDMTGINFNAIGAAGSKSYTGIFDGQANPITNMQIYGLADGTGLFYHLGAAGVVKNVDVSGYMNSAYKYMGGITGYLYGTVENCYVHWTMEASITGDGTHGGVAGIGYDGAVIKNVVAENVFMGEQTNCWGGLIGWSNGTGSTTCTNVLMLNDAMSEAMNASSNTISRNPDYCTLTNVYRINQLGTAAGTATTKEALSTGSICYTLNGSQSDEPIWFQTLGVDSVPHLFSGDVVYYYLSNYHNIAPVTELNSYAYNIQTASNKDAVTVSYSLVGPAEKGEIRFLNEAKEVVYTEPLTTEGLTVGAHEVTVANTNLPAAGTKLTLEVEVTGIGAVIGKQVGDSYDMWAPFALDVNNTPASPGFAQIYVLESIAPDAPKSNSYGAGTSHTGYISDDKLTGLYAFDGSFAQINAADGTPGFTGGLNYTENGVYINDDVYGDLNAISVSKDGRVFIGRAAGRDNSPIVEVNPADLNQAWTPVFTGGEVDPATGITYVGEEEQSRMIAAMATEGEGENLKLWTLAGGRSNGDYNTTDFACHSYNLGTAKTFSGAATVFEPLTGVYTITGGPVSIAPDGKGGLWYLQHRSSPTEEYPAIKHFNAEGAEDYSNITTAYGGGAMDINADGSLIAMGMGNKVVVYTCDYVPMANGMLFLTPKADIPTLESTITALAFDYANNLVVASSGTETVSRYTMPLDNKTMVTPGNAASSFAVGEDKATGIEGVEATTENGEIYSISGVRLNKAQKGINIINGKKVMVK